MSKIFKNVISPLLLSILLGGLCLYTYLCFQGVFTALLVDIGYYKLISKAICSLSGSGITRTIIYKIIFFLKDVLVQLFLCAVFIYWFSLIFRKRILFSAFFLLIGAIVVDYYFVLKYSDDFFGSILSYTMFFNGIIMSYVFNIILWFLVFMASIVLASAIKVRQSNKGIKLNSITSGSGTPHRTRRS